MESLIILPSEPGNLIGGALHPGGDALSSTGLQFSHVVPWVGFRTSSVILGSAGTGGL